MREFTGKVPIERGPAGMTCRDSIGDFLRKMSGENKERRWQGGRAEAAKANGIELLFTRAMQRGVKGDCEPVYWQGISVDLANIFWEA